MNTAFNYVIITDSTASLTDELIEKYNLDVMPLTYMLNGEEHLGYEKGKPSDLHAFYKAMREGAKVSTSCVNVDTAKAFFEPYLAAGKDVLYLAFSSGLSATCSNVIKASEELAAAYPERKFYVVDTLAACMGEGLIVTYALEAQLQGKSIDEVRAFTEKIKMKTCHQFTVDDLMYLKRGGRISGGTALIGTILKIKPVMCADNRGKLVAVGKVIGRKASIKWLFNKYVEKAYDKKNQIVYIAHCDCPDDAEALADMIREKSECKSITINYIDQVIGSHSGPGTLAIFFLGENREA
ncbi:MAG TPA: fatty acid-binding protein DegV [Clostridiales bacterium]|nr:fatty acid-binding protein DegV [Clostridiales bacterium]